MHSEFALRSLSLAMTNNHKIGNAYLYQWHKVCKRHAITLQSDVQKRAEQIRIGVRKEIKERLHEEK